MEAEKEDTKQTHNDKVREAWGECDRSLLLSSLVGEEPYGEGAVIFNESDIKGCLEIHRKKLVPIAVRLCELAGVELKYVTPYMKMSSRMGGFFAKTVVEECKRVDYYMGVDGNVDGITLFEKLVEAYKLGKS